MADVNDSRHLSQEVEKEWERLEEADITDDDREAIKAFAHRRENRVARNTLRQDMGNLRRAAERGEKPLMAYESSSDADRLFDALEATGVNSTDSKNAYVRALRVFFDWADKHPNYGDFEWYENIKDFSDDNNGDNNRRLTAEDYLSEAEVESLMQAAEHPREETLIDFLADTAARINLVCNLRRKDVDLDGERPTYRPNPNAEDGYKGVTQQRYPIHYSENSLRVWLNRHHPDDHPDAPLFPVKIGYDPDDRQNQALHPQSTLDALKTAAERAGIDRDRVHPHAFRHAAVRRMKKDPNFDFDWETVKLRTQWSDRGFEQMKELYGKLEEEEQLEVFFEHTDREIETTDETPAVFAECHSCGREIGTSAEFCRFCGANQTIEEEKMMPSGDQLKSMVREAVREELFTDDFDAGEIEGEASEESAAAAEEIIDALGDE
ncbi:MAG: tyrosine-type recombinase/integrase [Haloplanus sp.]